jgi:hypothetical protein
VFAPSASFGVELGELAAFLDRVSVRVKAADATTFAARPPDERCVLPGGGNADGATRRGALGGLLHGRERPRILTQTCPKAKTQNHARVWHPTA